MEGRVGIWLPLTITMFVWGHRGLGSATPTHWTTSTPDMTYPRLPSKPVYISCQTGTTIDPEVVDDLLMMEVTSLDGRPMVVPMGSLDYTQHGGLGDSVFRVDGQGENDLTLAMSTPGNANTDPGVYQCAIVYKRHRGLARRKRQSGGGTVIIIIIRKKELQEQQQQQLEKQQEQPGLFE